MENIKLILEIVAYVITIIGLPATIYVYFQEKKKERIDREYGTYNALDDKYIEFLKLCIENEDLGIYMIEKESPLKLTESQKKKKYAIYEILVCLFERAFLMYQGHSEKTKKHQWEGWNAYMEDWMENENFREAWHNYLGYQYELNFLDHMNSIYKKQMLAANQNDNEQ